MQFDPDNYPVSDYKFVPSSSLGVIAREYEVTQLVQLLQTLGQDSPIYSLLASAVVDNMGLSNREEIMAQMAEASKPNQAEQEAAQAQQQLQLELGQAQLQLVRAQGMEAQARAEKYMVEAQLEPEVVKAKLVAALSTNLQAGSEDDSEFAKRAKIAELVLKEADIKSNERIAVMQMGNKNRQP
tara:strand:- start:33 stop:584 length:552 start_codon:yes stop_codon:yes gene_type:complete